MNYGNVQSEVWVRTCVHIGETVVGGLLYVVVCGRMWSYSPNCVVVYTLMQHSASRHEFLRHYHGITPHIVHIICLP